MKQTRRKPSHSLSRLSLSACALLASLGHASAHAQDSTVNGDCENATFSLSPLNTKPSGMVLSPRSKEFVPKAQRTGLTQKRIALFGDMFAMNKDTPPRVSDGLRAIFARADLVLGNIEGPVSYNDLKLELDSNQFFNFHANVAYVKSVMAQYCIDPNKAIFTVANNHAGDPPLLSSASRWPDTVRNAPLIGATIVGIDRSPDTVPAITVKQTGDLTVGVVGWTHLQNKKPATDANGQINYPTWEASLRVTGKSDAENAQRVQNGTDWASRKRALGLDLLIGMPHWDNQPNRFPQPYTVRTADKLHGLGFDLIAGSHQDSLQPAKTWDGEDHDMTFYGLGNLTNAINTGANILVPVVELVIDGTGRVLEYTVTPFVMRYVGLQLFRPWLPSFNLCAGRAVYDSGRFTDWEVVPLEDLKTSDKTSYENINAHLDAVFPLPPPAP